MQNAPLSGLRVLDLSEFVSGPYCTRLLAMFGAEVIKIEKPDMTDHARWYESLHNDASENPRRDLFSYLNVNKKSITLNWSTRKGFHVLEQLVKQSDIVVENGEPGLLDTKSLQAANPSVILASISYFGQDGPYCQHKGSDIVSQALGGFMKLTGMPDSQPLKLAGPQAEYQAGLNASIAVMSSLFLRDETGIGDHIDISVMECLASILEGALLKYEYDGTKRERCGARHPTIYPSTILPCRDGWVHVDAGADWDTFCRFVDIPELLNFETDQLRQQADEIDELLKPWLANLTQDEVFHHAQEWRLPFTKVMETEEILTDPHLASRKFFSLIDGIPFPGAPFKLADFQPAFDKAPEPGEHNEEIYCGLLGYSADNLSQLRGMGVI